MGICRDGVVLELPVGDGKIFGFVKWQCRIQQEMQYKICKICGQPKLLICFHPHPISPDLLRYECVECEKKLHQEREYWKRPEKEARRLKRETRKLEMERRRMLKKPPKQTKAPKPPETRDTEPPENLVEQAFKEMGIEF